jgi:hypothetical protein
MKILFVSFFGLREHIFDIEDEFSKNPDVMFSADIPYCILKKSFDDDYIIQLISNTIVQNNVNVLFFFLLPENKTFIANIKKKVSEFNLSISVILYNQDKLNSVIVNYSDDIDYFVVQNFYQADKINLILDKKSIAIRYSKINYEFINNDFSICIVTTRNSNLCCGIIEKNIIDVFNANSVNYVTAYLDQNYDINKIIAYNNSKYVLYLCDPFDQHNSMLNSVFSLINVPAIIFSNNVARNEIINLFHDKSVITYNCDTYDKAVDLLNHLKSISNVEYIDIIDTFKNNTSINKFVKTIIKTII